MKTCDHLDNWIGAQVKNEQSLIITTGFVGQPTEDDARIEQRYEFAQALLLPLGEVGRGAERPEQSQGASETR